MNPLKRYSIIGIFFVLIAGTLSHFLYEWTGRSFIAGLFTPVNESTWEHMKLLFFPMLVYALFMIPKLRKKYPSVVPAAAFGILTGTILIPVIFYTYTGILGYHLFLLDVGTFAVSVVIAFYAVYKLSLSRSVRPYGYFLYGLLFLFLICFLWFTFFPPLS